MRVLKHLGSMSHVEGFTVTEREERLKSGRKAWFAMGSFWFSEVPNRVKFIVFFCVVYSTIISGLEAYVLTKTDNEQLNGISSETSRHNIHP